MRKLKVLVACEESQAVCKAFRELGHEAYSCDIQPCSGGHPEWHIQGDALEAIKNDWDLIIAHPPCTYLSNAATRSFSLKATPADKVVARWENRAIAAVFFMQFILAPCKHIAVENPVGFMTKAFRKPDQYIEPYMFCSSKDSEEYVTKKTGLWLKNLPLLVRVNNFERPVMEKYWSNYGSCWKTKDWCTFMKGHDAKERSKTFSGIAKAMAKQWSEYILKEGEQNEEDTNTI